MDSICKFYSVSINVSTHILLESLSELSKCIKSDMYQSLAKIPMPRVGREPRSGPRLTLLDPDLHLHIIHLLRESPHEPRGELSSRGRSVRPVSRRRILKGLESVSCRGEVSAELVRSVCQRDDE